MRGTRPRWGGQQEGWDDDYKQHHGYCKLVALVRQHFSHVFLSQESGNVLRLHMTLRMDELAVIGLLLQ